MKTIAVLLSVFAFGLGAVAHAASTPAAPAKAGAKAKKDEPPPKIKGLEIPRGDKGFLGLEIVNSTFKLTFYGVDRKPTTPDATRAVLHLPVHYQPAEERTVLNAGDDGHSLTSPKVIRPPWNFKLFITLLGTDANGKDTALETQVVDFHP
jgi:hypothetical protein